MRNLVIIAFLFISYSCSSKNEEDSSAQASTNTLTTPQEFAQVTQEYGKLVVQEGTFTKKSDILPWSSWWYPTKDKILFENSNPSQLAPLQKYDSYVEKTHGQNPNATLFEESDIYDPSEVNWAGLCHAWAVAAVIHVEPKFDIMKRDMMITVADQKALLLKSYENVDGLKYYGSRYDGGYQDSFDDIYPEQFHRFAQIYLFEKNLPFLMDYDPSYPVWTVPVYKVTFKIEKIDSNTAEVQAWVSTASAFVDASFVGTKESVKFYEYRLFGNWEGSNLIVTGSEWIKDAIYDHPDYLIAYPVNVKRATRNKGLDYSLIDELINTKFIIKHEG